MIKTILILAIGVFCCIGCTTDARVASKNLSEAAENFELNRRIVFINGITDTYLLSIVGKCSLDHQRGQLEVTCKLGDGRYKKHHLGLSDNVSYISEQIDAASVSVDHYRVTFKPSVIVPSIRLK